MKQPLKESHSHTVLFTEGQLDLRSAKERFEILAQNANELLIAEELQSWVQSTCVKIMKHLGCQVFFNFITTENNLRLRLNAYDGIPEEAAKKIEFLDFGSAVCGCVAAEGHRIIAEHIQTGGDPRTDLVRSYGVRAYASFPLFSKGGKIIGTLSFGTRERDTFSESEISLMMAVTDQVAIAMIRMDNKKKIKESEEKFSTAFRLNPSALALSRMEDGTILEVNDSYKRLLGWTEDEAAGHRNSIQDLLPNPGDREKIVRLLQTQKQINNVEVTINTRPGEKRIVLLSLSLLSMSQGELLLTSMHDITEQRETEQKLHTTLAELERSNKELEQFAYVASHDLQEPLRMVSNFARLLSKQYHSMMDEKADTYINFMVQGTKRMQSLINDLMQYSRISIKAQPFVPTDLNLVMEDVLIDLKMAIDEKNAYICYENLPVVEADPVQMRQLMQNLIANAIKYKGDSSPEIYIEAARHDGEWIICVRDNGIGINPEYHERIFVIFQMLHTKEKYSGNGIGLAVCKKIIERHNGRIWVDSEEGKGSAFYFSLPARMMS